MVLLNGIPQIVIPFDITLVQKMWKKMDKRSIMQVFLQGKTGSQFDLAPIYIYIILTFLAFDSLKV